MLLGLQISFISETLRILILVDISVHAWVTVYSSTGALGSVGSSCPALSRVLLLRGALVRFSSPAALGTLVSWLLLPAPSRFLIGASEDPGHVGRSALFWFLVILILKEGQGGGEWVLAESLPVVWGCPTLDQVLRLLLSVLQQPGSASQDPDHVQGGEGIKVLAADLGQALL